APSPPDGLFRFEPIFSTRTHPPTALQLSSKPWPTPAERTISNSFPWLVAPTTTLSLCAASLPRRCFSSLVAMDGATGPTNMLRPKTSPAALLSSLKRLLASRYEQPLMMNHARPRHYERLQ